MERAELVAVAVEAARAALASKWSVGRFEVEVESDEHGFSRLFERPHFQARVAVWEPAGLVAIDLDPGGTVRAVTPLAHDDDVTAELATLDEALVPRATEAALVELRSRGPLLGARAVLLGGTPRRGAVRAVLRGWVRHPDGLVVVDLDARSGEQIGHLCVPFLRGSRGGASISEHGAVERVRAALPLPGSAKLGRAKLEDAAIGRAWRIRFDVDDEDRAGAVIVTANARSGAVAGVVSTIRARVRLGPAPDQLVAEGEVRRAIAALLGPTARLAALVPGAVVRRKEPLPAWLGAVVDDAGFVGRVAVVQGEIEIAYGGKIHRMPTTEGGAA
jgi:hypothetical protein